MNALERFKQGLKELTPIQQLHSKIVGHIGCMLGLAIAMIIMSTRGLFYFQVFLFFLIWLQGVEAIGAYQRWQTAIEFQQNIELQIITQKVEGNK